MPSDRRPIWRGHLRLALVSCPVALYPAHREQSNLHFHFINPKTGNRVRMVTLDAETGDELERRDLVRGYEYEKGEYVLLDEDDFESARVDSSSMLNVDKFVDAASIDPVYFDMSYYMAPDGDTGLDVYAVLRDAIEQAGKVALSRLVLSRRERAVAIAPAKRGLIIHTLYEARDITNPTHLFDDVPTAKPDPDMIKLARQLIDRQSERYRPDDIEDRYEARLREVIKAKVKGEGPREPPKPPSRGDNVIDLMAALKKSLGQGGHSTSKAATAREAKPAARSKKGAAKASAKKSEKKPSTKNASKAPPTKPKRRASR